MFFLPKINFNVSKDDLKTQKGVMFNPFEQESFKYLQNREREKL